MDNRIKKIISCIAVIFLTISIIAKENIYNPATSSVVNTKVAANTKEDMLKQMKGVRNMPTSQANVNNASEGKKDTNDKMFDSLLNFDSGVDNMFG